jgi:hypothetical protein
VAFLVLLCGLQAVVRPDEICAGILAVPVEEEVVELTRQIIMMGDVATRATYRIVLLEPSHHGR